MGGRWLSLCAPVCQLSGTLSTWLETGFAEPDALQPQDALGAERIHRVDHRRFRHTHLAAACRTPPGRPRGPGPCLLYRDLLDYPDSRGRVLFLPRGLAQRAGICRGPYPPDTSVFFPRRKLRRAIHLALMVERPPMKVLVIGGGGREHAIDRKSTRLNSSH